MYYTFVSFIILTILYRYINKIKTDMNQLKKEHYFIMKNNNIL